MHCVAAAQLGAEPQGLKLLQQQWHRIHLSVQLPLGSFEVFDEQVLACQLMVVGEVVDALPFMQVHLVKLIMNPAATMRQNSMSG